MKKKSLLFLFLALASMRVFAVSPPTAPGAAAPTATATTPTATATTPTATATTPTATVTTPTATATTPTATVTTPTATVAPTPASNYDPSTQVVFIPKVLVTATDGNSTLYENVELSLKTENWVVLKASLLDIEFGDADIVGVPDFDLKTSIVYFPKVTINNKEASSAELLLAASGRWRLISLEPLSLETNITAK